MPAIETTRDALPPPHRMIHPGPVAQPRLTFAQVSDIISETIELAPYQSIHDAITGAAKALGGTSGTATLHDGALSKTRFTTGGPARDGRAAHYTYIREWGSSRFIAGTASFGLGGDNGHFVHCHAIIREAQDHNGAIGGHFFSPDCMISEPIFAHMCVFDGVTLEHGPDAETLHSVFEVAAAAPPQATETGREFFIRLRPNEDLGDALSRFCAENGIAEARLGGSLGSLNAPALAVDDKIVQVTSVGTEIVALTGTVTPHGSNLSGAVVDEDGTIFAGEFVPGHCPVCVTAEIHLSEVLSSSG